MMARTDKLGALKSNVSRYGSAVVAFSGGVDSTFLARVAGDALDGKLLLVTASSAIHPAAELEESKRLADLLGLPRRVIVSKEMEIPGFAENSPDRCYYCKLELFRLLTRIAQEEQFGIVLDGSNADDVQDYRPGRRALKELGIKSPLCESGLTKADIRAFSRELGLPTAEKPAFACLASRFPYGEKITEPKLSRVDRAEQGIRAAGFRHFRVRSHQDLARLEFACEDIARAWRMRGVMHAVCKEAGYAYVAMDLEGYRLGAMNEVLGLYGDE